MGEELPDGTIQGYSRLCEKCGEEISCNIQGNTSQKCELIETPSWESATVGRVALMR